MTYVTIVPCFGTYVTIVPYTFVTNVPCVCEIETTQSFFNIFGTAIRFTRTRDNGDKTPVTFLLAGLRISQATLTRKRYAQNKCQRSADKSLRADDRLPALNTHRELVSGGCQSNTTTQSPVESRYQQQVVGQPEQHEGADRGSQGILEAYSAMREGRGHYEQTPFRAGNRYGPILLMAFAPVQIF